MARLGKSHTIPFKPIDLTFVTQFLYAYFCWGTNEMSVITRNLIVGYKA